MPTENMTIEDFVDNALGQIQRASKKYHIVPRIPVKFEIGVVVSKNTGTETKGGLNLSVASVLSLGASGNTSKHDTTEEYNRLSFSVELYKD